MPTAVIYARISQDRVGAGLGVARQVDDARALATRLGLDVVTVLDDNDLSAFNRRKPRPGYQELLEGLRTRRWDVLITWHTDRLHRNNRELEDFIDAVEASGAGIYTVQAGEIDLSAPSGRMVARVLGAIAQGEAEHKGERHRAHNRQQAEMGRFHGGGHRPFGWGLPVGTDPVTGVELVDRQQTRPDEADLIRDAVAKVLAGASWSSIATAWNTAGVVTTTGRPWTREAVVQALTAPRHAGLTIVETGPDGPVFGHAPVQIITPEDHHALVAASHQRRTTLSNSRRYLLSGIALCGAEGCGKPLNTRGRTGSGLPVYRCSGYRPGVPHRGHVYRVVHLLDEAATELVVVRLARQDAVRLLDADDSAARVAAVEARRLRDQLNRAAAMWRAGTVDDEQLAEMTAGLRPLLAEAERRSASSSRAKLFGGLVGHGDRTRAVWDGLDDLPRQRAVVDALMWLMVLPTGKTGRGFRPEGIRFGWKL